MSTNYRVSRRGRELFRGPQSALVRLAASSGVHAEDLVFDPQRGRWVFARALPVLSGSPLLTGPVPTVRSRRAAAEIRRSLPTLVVVCALLIAAGLGVWFVADQLFVAPRVGSGSEDGLSVIVPFSGDAGPVPDRTFLVSPESMAREVAAALSSEERATRAAELVTQAEAVLSGPLPPGREGEGRVLSALAAAKTARLHLSLNGQAPPPELAKTTDGLESLFRKHCRARKGPRYCELRKLHPGWTESVLEHLDRGVVTVGMTRAQVITAWGEPDSSQPDGRSLRLCYGDACRRFCTLHQDVVVAANN